MVGAVLIAAILINNDPALFRAKRKETPSRLLAH
jgi:hypothetical protein